MNRILYNVTVNIDHNTHEEWVEWMKSTHIPDVMATGKFITYQLQKIIETENETGVTYSIQYLAPNMQAYREYHENHSAALQAEHAKRYNGKYGAFRTLMEVLDMSN